MTNWLLRKLGISALTVVLASVVVFLGIHALPGDPIETIYGQSGRVSAEQLAEIRTQYGLDKPLLVQYLDYVWQCLHGNFGTSAANGLPVGQSIAQRLPVTLEVAGLSIIFALILGCAAGACAALAKGRTGDYVVNAIGLIALSLPTFWLGLMLILFIGERAHWLPSSGFTPLLTDPAANLKGMVLPVITLGVSTAAILMRQMRSAMVESLEADYIRTAWSKGLRRRRVVMHAARNSLTSVVTITGLQLGFLISGTVVIEQVFTLPGFGKLLLESVAARDYAVVQGIALLTAVGYVLINLCIDVLYSVVDPRVRASGGDV